MRQNQRVYDHFKDIPFHAIDLTETKKSGIVRAALVKLSLDRGNDTSAAVLLGLPQTTYSKYKTGKTIPKGLTLDGLWYRLYRTANLLPSTK